MDELAVALGSTRSSCGVRNEPAVDPESGHPFSSRHLVECLRRGRAPVRLGRTRPGAGRAPRGPVARSAPGWRRSTYPARPGHRRRRRGRGPTAASRWRSAAADIGTGARTALTQVAADALGVPVERVYAADRRQPIAAGPGGRRVDGHRLVGHGGGEGVPRAARDRRRPRTAAARRRHPGGGRHRRRPRGAGRARAASRVRRAVRGGTGRRRHRRGAGAAAWSACSRPDGS